MSNAGDAYTDPPEDSRDRQEWVARLVKECQCGCLDCGDRPCAGLMAGGSCDQMHCSCNDEDDNMREDDE